MLVDQDYSDIANWIDLVKADAVLSVNGKEGVVSIDLADFPEVIAALAEKAPLTSPALSGNPTAPTQPAADNSARIATTAFVKNQGFVVSGDLEADLADYAKSDSPAFTGTPTAPTPETGANNARIATTAFVKNQGYALADTIIATTAPLTGGGSLTESRTLAIADATISSKGAVKLSSAVNSDSETLAATSKAVKTVYDLAAGKAGLVSPAFSGAPTAPTPAASDDSARIATTAFVQNLISNSGNSDIGDIKMTARSTPPSGWLVCNGAEISRTAYAGLFAAIGTVFGNGDGITTFNLPDLRGRTAVGAGQGVDLTDRALGAKGGEEKVHIEIANLPSMATGFVTVGMGKSIGYAAGTPYSSGWMVNCQPGGGTALDTMPPYAALTMIIYAGK